MARRIFELACGASKPYSVIPYRKALFGQILKSELKWQTRIKQSQIWGLWFSMGDKQLVKIWTRNSGASSSFGGLEFCLMKSTTAKFGWVLVSPVLISLNPAQPMPNMIADNAARAKLPKYPNGSHWNESFHRPHSSTEINILQYLNLYYK